MTARHGNPFHLAVLAVLVTAGPAFAAEAAPAGEPAKAGPTTDWPQWRGPDRSGMAPGSPKLLDRWPDEGPKRVWESAPIPSSQEGGAGSVVVAGGKAFVYANIRHDASHDPQRIQQILGEVLDNMGWMEGVPDALVKTVEETRLSDTRAGTAGGGPLKKYVKEFIATIDPELVKKYGSWVSSRVYGGRGTIGWEALGKLAALREQQFPSIGAFNQAAEQAVAAEAGAAAKITAAMVDKLFNYTDDLFCRDAATGKELWKDEIPSWRPGREDMGNFGASSTPSIVADRCYVQGCGALYCLSATDGKVIWQTKTAFSHSSPLVADGKVFVFASTVDVGHERRPLSAYSAQTGQLVWEQRSVASDGISSAVLWTHDDKRYLICNAVGYWTGMKAHGISCIDPEKGDVLWNLPNVGGSESSSSPTIDGDIAVVDGGEGAQAVRLSPRSGTLLWTVPPRIWRAASPVVYQDHVYLVNSDHLRCLDLQTGAIVWERKDVTNHFSSPILADGKIICPAGGRDHNYYLLLAATPEKFAELGHLGKSPDGKHLGACCSSPTIADGRLYLRLTDRVACFDLRAEGN